MARWFRRSGGSGPEKGPPSGVGRGPGGGEPLSRGGPEGEEPLELADRLRLEYGRTGAPALLLLAERAAEEAVRRYAADDARHASALSALCMLNRLRWERERDAALLERAVAYGRRAVEASPPGDPELPRHMSSLATSLQEAFDHQGRTQDIDEAITLYRSCLDLLLSTDPERPGIQSNLANSLLRRGDSAGLDEALELAQDALADTPPDDPMHAVRLINLGGLVFTLAQRGRVTYLVIAHEMYEQGLRELPPGHPARGQVAATVRQLRRLRQRFGI